MKKGILILSLLLSCTSFAQVHEHAIGLRGGSGSYSGFGPEVSYQLGFNDKNRLELDLGWFSRKNWNNGNGWGSGYAYSVGSFTGCYHWVWNLVDGLNGYAGPGAQLTLYNEQYYDNNDGIYIGLGGQLGLEYDFSDLGVPLHVGLDYRPMFLFTWNGLGNGAGLSLRYLIN